MNALNMRLLASRLAESNTRDALGRWLLIACAGGFLVSLAILHLLRLGLDRWVFVLIVWAVLIFIPLRILVEALRPYGMRMRGAVTTSLARDPQRFERPELLPVVVADLFAREVTMPRITKPQQALKAREAAVAILTRVGTGEDAEAGMAGAIRATLAAAGIEAVAVSVAATGVAADNIQARWDGARALGALAALVTILAASYRDRWGAPPDLPELEGRPLRDYLEAAFDYCDEVALQIDALPWTEPPLVPRLSTETVENVRVAWRDFLAAGPQAARALDALLVAVLPVRR